MDDNTVIAIIIGITAAYYAFKTWVNRNKPDCTRFHEDGGDE